MKTIPFTDDEFHRIANAAYWEGADSPQDFVLRVMRRHLRAREAEREAIFAEPPKGWQRERAL